MDNLNTNAHIDWCPGCGNFAILNAIKQVLNDLRQEGTSLENVVLISGIGQHAKIVDYLNVNSFYSLHGRTIPPAEAIKLANPKLKVICFAGDGDCYGEGLEHLVFAAKRNIDISVFVHNNRVYALTTGQFTPTSPLGYKGRSTPQGNPEMPLNPLEVALASNATFLARCTSRSGDLMKRLMKEAILHHGFSLLDILQVCVIFFDAYEYYNKRVYELVDHNPLDYNLALQKIREWDYNSDSPIACGVFFKKEAPVFNDKFASLTGKPDKETLLREILKNMI